MNNKLDNHPTFMKYPKIPYLEFSSDIIGKEAYIFEKVDGSLSQVRRTTDGIHAGSKANYITGSSKRPIWSSDFLKWMHSSNSLYNLKQGLIMFGEWLEPVTLDYDPEKLRKFYFIDLAIVQGDDISLFDYEEAVGYLKQWEIDKDIEILPPIDKRFIDANYLNSIVLSRESMLGSDKIEGLVLKNYKTGDFAKFLHPKYSEIRKEEETLEKIYINKIRVTKAIRRMSDNGIQDPSLEQVGIELMTDIREETDITFSEEAIKGVIRARCLFDNKRED